MPHNGATTFGDLVGRLEELRVTCEKCEPRRPLPARTTNRPAWLRAEDFPDWLTGIAKDCLRRIAGRPLCSYCAARWDLGGRWTGRHAIAAIAQFIFH